MGGFWRVRTNHCRRRIDARIRRLKGLRMRAVVCTRYGPPEVLRLKELATPTPRKNELRTRIRATAVTSSDCHVQGLRLTPAHRIMARLALGWNAPRAVGTSAVQLVRHIGAEVTGEIRPVIDRTYALDDISDAHAYVDNGHKRGNVVVTVP